MQTDTPPLYEKKKYRQCGRFGNDAASHVDRSASPLYHNDYKRVTIPFPAAGVVPKAGTYIYFYPMSYSRTITSDLGTLCLLCNSRQSYLRVELCGLRISSRGSSRACQCCEVRGGLQLQLRDQRQRAAKQCCYRTRHPYFQSRHLAC